MSLKNVRLLDAALINSEKKNISFMEKRDALKRLLKIKRGKNPLLLVLFCLISFFFAFLSIHFKIKPLIVFSLGFFIFSLFYSEYSSRRRNIYLRYKKRINENISRLKSELEEEEALIFTKLDSKTSSELADSIFRKMEFEYNIEKSAAKKISSEICYLLKNFVFEEIK